MECRTEENFPSSGMPNTTLPMTLEYDTGATSSDLLASPLVIDSVDPVSEQLRHRERRYQEDDACDQNDSRQIQKPRPQTPFPLPVNPLCSVSFVFVMTRYQGST